MKVRTTMNRTGEKEGFYLISEVGKSTHDAYCSATLNLVILAYMYF